MNTDVHEKQDPPKFHFQNALIGAVYGLLMATVFVLAAAMIDKWLYPLIPFGVDWSQALTRWALIGLGLTLVGAMTCLFTESIYGLAAGAFTAALLALTSALYLTPLSGGAKIIGLVFTLTPIAVMSLPISLVIRRLAESHLHALSAKWSGLRIVLVVLVAVALGAGAGYFMKMSKDALLAVQMVHENLQVAPEEQKKEVSQAAGLQEHAGMPYSLSQRRSMSTTTGYDIRAEYEDGYVVECVVVLYPGAKPYIRSCEQIK